MNRLGVEQPRFLGWSLAAAEALVSGPVQIAVVNADDPSPLTATAWRARPGGAVVISGRPDAPGVALLRDRPLVGGKSAAYVCRGFVCDRPVTTTDELVGSLGADVEP